jgi:anti-sigma-K factor RskA
MTEDFTTEALAYLLQELDPVARVRFEERLAAEPAAAAAVKSLADALATYALEDSPPQALTAGEARATLAAALTCVTAPAAARRPSAVIRYFWPVAAALLLALNLGQWWLHSRSPPGPTTAEIYAEEIAQQKEQDRLDLAEKTGRERGSPRLLTVDLVDNGLAERGSRKGMVYVEPATLKKAGVVAAGPGTNSSTVIIQRSTVTLSFSPSPKADARFAAAYAWSAFDQSRHQGFLDLHNLPNVSPNRSLQLWVRAAGSAAFEKVGEIPAQFYGRSGSVTYKLPSATVVPAQIMVTVESRSSPPQAPTGPVVLHGP